MVVKVVFLLALVVLTYGYPSSVTPEVVELDVKEVKDSDEVALPEGYVIDSLYPTPAEGGGCKNSDPVRRKRRTYTCKWETARDARGRIYSRKRCL